jgi:hypothetical protein
MVAEGAAIMQVDLIYLALAGYAIHFLHELHHAYQCKKTREPNNTASHGVEVDFYWACIAPIGTVLILLFYCAKFV